MIYFCTNYSFCSHSIYIDVPEFGVPRSQSEDANNNNSRNNNTLEKIENPFGFLFV
jgi:hypothetical protein